MKLLSVAYLLYYDFVCIAKIQHFIFILQTIKAFIDKTRCEIGESPISHLVFLLQSFFDLGLNLFKTAPTYLGIELIAGSIINDILGNT